MLYIYSFQQTLMATFVEMLPFTYHFQSQQEFQPGNPDKLLGEISSPNHSCRIGTGILVHT
jgi:hypothetical protein